MGETGENAPVKIGRYTNKPVKYDYLVKARSGIFGDEERSTVVAAENGVSEVGLGNEQIKADQITKVEVTGLWMPSIDRKGKVTFHESGASWLYDTLIEEGLRIGRHEGISGEDLYKKSQQNALGILTELSAEDTKITCNRLVLPGGITLHYYQLGEVVTDKDKIPFGLASVIEGWMSIRQRLGLVETKLDRNRVEQIVFFDSKVFRDVTPSDPESDSTVINCLKGTVRGGCFSNLGGIIQVDGGYVVRDQEGEWNVVVNMNKWRALGWHEIGHSLDKLVGIISNEYFGSVLAEGWAELCSLVNFTDFDQVMNCQQEYSLPKISRNELVSLMGVINRADVSFDKGRIYGVSGAFMWYIYRELGALGVKRLCALMSGNYGSQHARYEQKCEGDLIKSLEAAGNIKDGFDHNKLIDQFVVDYNERREKKIVFGEGLDVSKIPPGKIARSLPNSGGWEIVDEDTPW